MKWGAYRTVRLASIIAPGDLRERQKAPHVVALAETFRAYGGRPGNAMWVRKAAKGWQLVAGRDRFAALMLNGVKADEAREVLDATPAELADLETIENLYRRPVPNRDTLIAARVAKLAAVIAGEREASFGTDVPKVGRPKSVEGEARERVAAGMGSTPAAVKMAERRAKVREEGAAASGSGAQNRKAVDAPPPPIETFGRAMPAHMVGVDGIVAKFNAIEALFQKAQREAGELSMYATCQPGVIERLKRVASDAAALVRAEAPYALCPKCKGESHPVSGPHCGLCQERGWVTRGQYGAAPTEQRAALEVAEPKAPPSRTLVATAKKARGMTVELDGRELSLAELEAEAGAMHGDDERPEIDEADLAF